MGNPGGEEQAAGLTMQAPGATTRLSPHQRCAQAQTETGEAAKSATVDQREAAAVDRAKQRLQLLISLVENQLRAATDSKTQLTTETGRLKKERTELAGRQTQGRLADKVRLQHIDQRLLLLNEKLAAIGAQLPDVTNELDDLQRRLDETNGIVRDVDTTAVEDDAEGIVEMQPSPSQWLDGNHRIQEALVYLGGYDALIDGDLGPRTRQAVKVYQERQAFKPTGVLTDEQAAALFEEAEAWRQRYGMKVFSDEKAGYRLTYPSLLLSEMELVDPDTRRMVMADGSGELLITASNGSIDIDSMYNDLLDRYEVQYRRKRDNWFVIGGLLDDERIIYDTLRETENGVIRARLTYPTTQRNLWSPFAIMMFNSFEAVPRGES